MTYSPFYFNQQGLGSSRQVTTNFYNGTGLAIPQGSPVSKTGTSNHIALTDVTDEASTHAFVGFAQVRIQAGEIGPVITSGRLENLSGYSFSIGDAIYVGVGGIIQNVKPDYGVTGFAEGDFVIFAGVIVENENNSLEQDLMVISQLVGEL